MSEFDYTQLDPGIRDTVRRLRHYDFNTTDSGDGVSKPADARTFHEPHVHIAVGKYRLFHEARAAQRVLGPDWYVEASYSTRDDTAILTCLRRDVLDKAVKAMGYTTDVVAPRCGTPLDSPADPEVK
jgi:hypothetical protein